MNIKKVFMKEYSSLRVGGEGRVIAVTSLNQLKEAIAYAKENDIRAHILGEGTNSYFGEDLSSFLFIKMCIRGIDIDERNEGVRLSVGSGEIWDDIVELAVDKGWWGIENLSHIPGSVGAAPVQNIGAYGAELSNVLESLTVFDVETMEEKILTKDDCRFGYRDSVFKYPTSLKLHGARPTSSEGSPSSHEATTGRGAGRGEKRYVITEVKLKLSRRPTPLLEHKPLDSLSVETATLQSIRDLVIATRSAKLPDWHEYPNAGSFFKNAVIDVEAAELLRPVYSDMPFIQAPEGYKIPTAWLIDHIAEMKGVRVGDIGTWSRQPLVIVNYGEATADDIDGLAKEIHNKVHEKTGIMLEQEVNRIG